MVKPIVADGTDERRWAAWSAPATWERLSLTFTGATAPLVVAPHPDDEVLGVGGLLSMVDGAQVIVVTDGEASHPGSRVYGRAELAAIRRAETAAACQLLGVPRSDVHHLGQPDGAVDETSLTEVLCRRLRPGQWCLTTWRGDGHPDHEAVGRAAALACQHTGAVLLEFPIWAWHWAVPDAPEVPWHRARRVDLTEGARAAKARAINEFPSQILPLGPEPADAAILPPNVLARFARPYETVFI
ncbi:PIG-L deacetylase family protein [Micromonospora sp. NPDC005553]|uniref:PIG-L deacetylase family protein n=1 Tax=Micromonospora sp. NPDC005553 TaxID=3364232 RepID=UPI0036CA6B9E